MNAVAQSRQKFPVIVGPTAGGKTALAVAVAKLLGGEVVTADSVQIYRGLDIGSAKPTTAERDGVPHHLIDIVEPDAVEPFSVHDWLGEAERVIREIQSRSRRPVVVGGTHMYVKAFLEGMFEGPAADESIREELRTLSIAELRAQLERIDKATAARLHPNDQRRTIRAIEVWRLTGKPISTLQTQWDQNHPPRADCVLVGLEWPIETINQRINARVKGMVERGLVDEVQGLWKRGRLGVQAREALGYKQLIDHFEGRTSLDDAIEEIKIQTRRFAKNQRTWLRRLRMTPGSLWIDADAVPEGRWPAMVVAACGI